MAERRRSEGQQDLCAQPGPAQPPRPEHYRRPRIPQGVSLRLMADAVRRELATPVARRWPRAGAFALALAALLVSATVAVLVGPANISVADVGRVILNHLPYGTDYSVEASVDAIVWEIRLPRVLLAGAVGASLAFSGAA